MSKSNSTRKRPQAESVAANKDDASLADRWLKGLKNNPVVAAFIVLAACASGILAFYSQLPAPVQSIVTDALPHKDATATNGWAWAGYLDKHDTQAWATGPFVTLVRKSGGLQREYPLRSGDIVSPNKDLPQVIVDYRTRKNDNVLVAPSSRRAAIQPADDYTGAKFKAGNSYLVADVAVNAFRDHDFVVWLRLIPEK